MPKFSYFEFIKHALGTPISSILLNSQLALNEEKPRQYLKDILSSAMHVKKLLDQDQCPKQKQLFNVNSALVEIIFLNQCFHKQVSYNKHLQQSAKIQIKANKLLFQEVIHCLLNNAVEAYLVKPNNRIILIKTQLINQQLQIAISDGGQGMGPLNKLLIGHKFYSSKARHRGVGLFYVKKILKTYFDGKLQILSKKGRGTTALITIPLT